MGTKITLPLKISPIWKGHPADVAFDMGKREQRDFNQETFDKELAALHTRIEQLEANLPGENDIKHLSTCLVDCCPKCDDILLAYQRRLQARAKSQSSVGPAERKE